jgi:hypothetical protein
MNDRYQNQTYWTRRLRDLYLFLVPLEALKLCVVDRYTCAERQYVTRPLTVKQCWSIAIGLAHARMQYVWSWQEIKKRKAHEETACTKQETLLDIN